MKEKANLDVPEETVPGVDIYSLRNEPSVFLQRVEYLMMTGKGRNREFNTSKKNQPHVTEI